MKTFLILCTLMSLSALADIEAITSNGIRGVVYREGDWVFSKQCSSGVPSQWDRNCQGALNPSRKVSFTAYASALYTLSRVDTQQPYQSTPEAAATRLEMLNRIKVTSPGNISVAGQKEIDVLILTLKRMGNVKQTILQYLEVGNPLMVDFVATPKPYFMAFSGFLEGISIGGYGKREFDNKVIHAMPFSNDHPCDWGWEERSVGWIGDSYLRVCILTDGLVDTL